MNNEGKQWIKQFRIRVHSLTQLSIVSAGGSSIINQTFLT